MCVTPPVVVRDVAAFTIITRLPRGHRALVNRSPARGIVVTRGDAAYTSGDARATTDRHSGAAPPAGRP